MLIYDVSGRFVTSLVDGFSASGIGTVKWGGRDGVGDAVASGVYFARLEFDGQVQTRKLVLLK